MIDKDIVLPSNKLIDKGFFNGCVDKKAAPNYADKLIEDGIAKKEQRDDLIIGLNQAAKYYFMGKSINEGEKCNTETKKEIKKKRQNKLKKELKDLPGIDQTDMPLDDALEVFSKSLKLPPRGYPKKWAERGVIWIMAMIWNGYLGFRLGTAENGPGAMSRFQCFTNDWLKIIDPTIKILPGRKTYRNAFEDFYKSGCFKSLEL